VSDALLLTAIAAGTALATGVGALPVLALGGERARAAQKVLSGLAAGVMAVAAVVGLLKPAAEQGSAVTVTTAAAAGALALVLSRRVLNHRAEGKGRSEVGARSLLVIGVLFAHSPPEGLAIWECRVQPGGPRRVRHRRDRDPERARRDRHRSGCNQAATGPGSRSGVPS
jgi:zinc transporter ZupT